MKKLFRLYLAHNFNDRAEVRRFELDTEGKYKVELFNPFYDTDRDDVQQLDKMGEKQTRYEREQWDMSKCKELVERDLREIRHSDGILTIIKSASLGTAMEIITAAYFYKIPVYVITKNFAFHPWLRYMVDLSDGGLFETKKQFKIWLEVNGYKRRIRRVWE